MVRRAQIKGRISVSRDSSMVGCENKTVMNFVNILPGDIGCYIARINQT